MEYWSSTQAKGTAAPSCVAELIGHNEIDEEQMKWIGATFFSAGTDTVGLYQQSYFID